MVHRGIKVHMENSGANRNNSKVEKTGENINSAKRDGIQFVYGAKF